MGSGTVPESSHSLDHVQQVPLLLGTSVALLISTVFLFYVIVASGGLRCYRACWCTRGEEGDPASGRWVAEKMDRERRDNLKAVGLMVALMGMTNCLLIVVNTLTGRERWMTAGQDIVISALTLYAVGSHFWLRATSSPSVVHLSYAGFMTLVTCFVVFSSATSFVFIFVVTAAKGAQMLLSIAVASPAVASGMALVFCLCSNLAFASTTAPCRDDFFMSQSTFACVEVLADIYIIALTMMWRRFCASRVASEFQGLISQSETLAVRSLLNTVCDATVALDAKLNIVGDAPRLASLLQHGHGRSLDGVCVTHLVLEEDHEKFRSYFEFPKATADEGMATVFNVRVRDSISNIINVEVFLVSIPNSMVSTSYLIGVREFTDAEASFDSTLRAPMTMIGGAWAEAAAGVGAGAALPVRAAGPGPADEDKSCAPGRTAESRRVAGAGTVSHSASSGRGDSAILPGGAPAVAEGCDAGGAAGMAICFDLIDDAYDIKRVTGGFHVFLSPRRRENRFIHWLQHDQAEHFISWAQSACLGMRDLQGSGQNPGAAVYPEELLFQPTLIQRTRFGFASSVTMDVALGERSSTSVRLVFGYVKLVEWNRDRL